MTLLEYISHIIKLTYAQLQLGIRLFHTVIIIKTCKIMMRHLFAVHHLMVKEEKHSLLTLGLRLGEFSQFP